MFVLERLQIWSRSGAEKEWRKKDLSVVVGEIVLFFFLLFFSQHPNGVKGLFFEQGAFLHGRVLKLVF